MGSFPLAFRLEVGECTGGLEQDRDQDVVLQAPVVLLCQATKCILLGANSCDLPKISSSLRGQGKTAPCWQRYSTSCWSVMAEMSTPGSPSSGMHRRTNCSCGCIPEISPRMHGGHHKRSCRMILTEVSYSSRGRSVSIVAFLAAL